MSTLEYPALVRSRNRQLVSDSVDTAKWLLRKTLLAFYPPLILPPPLKRAVLRKYAQKYGLSIFVETGTWLGDTVESLSHVCDSVFSIELQPELAWNAKRRFEGRTNIHILRGSGPEVLPAILGIVNKPALFWLDAHFHPTEKDVENCPTMRELALILDHSIQGHVVCIDDMREFKGVRGYPTTAELSEQVSAKWPSARIEIVNDIMRITP